MKISELKVGDVFEDYRNGTSNEVTAIGQTAISFTVFGARPGFGRYIIRKRNLTHRQFERLQFIRIKAAS